MSRTDWSVLSVAGMLAILLAESAVSLRGQEHPVPVVRTTTRLVQLNVVVVDKQGKPVSNLTQEDFQVFDNGSEQKLSHFSVSSVVVPNVRPAASPLLVTNRPQGGQDESARSMTAILVDELGEQEPAAIGLRATMQSARLAILKFLGTLQPGDQIALYALRTEGVVVVHDFTDDPAELVAAAETLGSGLLGAATPSSADVSPSANIGRPANISRAPAASGIHDWLAGSGGKTNVPRYDSPRRVIVGSAFQAIAEHLRDVRGRKNVVWISSNFPPLWAGLPVGPCDYFADTQSHYEELRGFARWLSSTNLSLYPLDPKGLPCDKCADPVSGPVMGGCGGVYVPPPPTSVRYLFGERHTMDLVASETGGRAFYETNGMDQILREVLDENRVTYELGYYPGDAAWDGKYHKIELKVKGDGLAVRCRKGYFAVDEPVAPNPEAALRDAAKSVVESLGIGLSVKVPSNPLGGPKQEIVMNVATHDVHFDQKDGRWKAQLDVALVQLAGDGRILEDIKDHLELALQQDTYVKAAVEGYLYPKTVNIKPEAEKLRVVVRDLATGAVGSVSVPVHQDKGT
jgi:VWFA-related protein